MLGALKTPPTIEGRPLGFTGRFLLFPLVHAAVSTLTLIGMRDRLRCPSCRAVGTWKPHGTILARLVHQDRPARRWMCKWCGLYVGPEGIIKAFPDLERGWWTLPNWSDPGAPEKPGSTPQDVVAEALVQKSGKPVWPWRG
jgi:hypothetical protein